MHDIWVISDTHFNHDNILTFISGVDGVSKVRPGFSDVEEMNETLIENWNKVVKPEDKIYHLGDLGMKEKLLGPILDRLNGQKRLILGNHDGFKMAFYSKYFKKIMESRNMDGVLMTHRPVFLGEHEAHLKVNLHGHIHEQNLKNPRYMNVSVEQTNYTPVHFDDVLKNFKDKGIL